MTSHEAIARARRLGVPRAAMLLLLSAPAARSQPASAIAARVAAAPNGEVRMTYATRANVCGDGKDIVAVGRALEIHSSISTFGNWSGVACLPGAARVAITVRDHEIVAIHAHVGGAWKSAEGAVVDLGRVPAASAATYFLSLAPSMGASARRGPLLPAALADSANITPDLLRLARDPSLPRDTRRGAVHWAGVVGDASTVAPLVELARGAGDGPRANADDPGPGDDLASAAVGALSMLENGAGLDALMELARHGSTPARKAGVFWLGQRDEPRARALVRTVVSDEAEPGAVRGAAIFALGQGKSATAADGAFLRDVFGRLRSETLKDRVLMAIAQSCDEEGSRWLLAQARDDRQPIEMRRKAVFWAGQGHARVADITSLYSTVQDARLREHVIFVLSQRREDAATDALIGIARSDASRDMRAKALFWLAQKNDPRVTKMIAELVAR
jgi:hypothetical protein